MIDVSVIIVNFNNTALIQNCIASVMEQTKGVSYEIIVSDNGSTDGVDQLQKYNVKLVENKANIGFGKANNAGVTCASGQFLFFLNPDTVLLNDAISHLVSFLRSHPEVGGCGGNLLSSDLQPTHSFHRMPPSILREMDYAGGRLFSRIAYGKNAEYNHTEKSLEVAGITGADLMLRRDVYEAVSGFDERFFMYYEDADLCTRIRKKGYALCCVPQAKIQHLEGCSYSVSEIRERHILQGRNTYFHVHYSRFYNRIADFLNIITLSVACVVYRVRHSSLENKYSLRLKLYKELCQTK